MQNQWVRSGFPTENRRAEPPVPVRDELQSIARAIEKLGCRMGENPERAILRKEALADRVRAVAVRIDATETTGKAPQAPKAATSNSLLKNSRARGTSCFDQEDRKGLGST